MPAKKQGKRPPMIDPETGLTRRRNPAEHADWCKLRESDAYWETVQTLIAEGSRVQDIAGHSGTTFGGWYQYMLRHRQEYYEAGLAARSERARLRIEALADELVTGNLDPKAARVILDTQKWLAGTGGGRRSLYREDRQAQVNVQVNNSTDPFAGSYAQALRQHNASLMLKRDPAVMLEHDSIITPSTLESNDQSNDQSNAQQYVEHHAGHDGKHQAKHHVESQGLELGDKVALKDSDPVNLRAMPKVYRPSLTLGSRPKGRS
jgi:hypothetical protein